MRKVTGWVKVRFAHIAREYPGASGTRPCGAGTLTRPPRVMNSAPIRDTAKECPKDGQGQRDRAAPGGKTCATMSRLNRLITGAVVPLGPMT